MGALGGSVPALRSRDRAPLFPEDSRHRLQIDAPRLPEALDISDEIVSEPREDVANAFFGRVVEKVFKERDSCRVRQLS